MINFKLIFRILGFLLVVEGAAILIALMVALIYNGPDIKALLQSTIICVSSGSIILALTRKARKEMGKREGFIIVTLSWVLFSFFGSLPFILSNSIPNLTDAFFETMSGFTTTGSSDRKSVV